MRARLWAAAAVSLGLLGAADGTQAVPYTMYFAGEIAIYRDTSGRIAEGDAFFGYLTYDVSAPQNFVSDSANGSTWADARTQAGCSEVTNGVCTHREAGVGRIVTDYMVSWSGGTYRPHGTSLDYYEVSHRRNVSNSSPQATLENWVAELDQRQDVIVGDLAGDYTVTSVFRQLSVTPYTYTNNDLLLDPLTDLTKGFDVSATPARQWNVYLDSVNQIKHCSFMPNERNCRLDTTSRDGFSLIGILKTAEFREGAVSQAPEPTTLALLGLGLAGLAATRRRRQ